MFWPMIHCCNPKQQLLTFSLSRLKVKDSRWGCVAIVESFIQEILLVQTQLLLLHLLLLLSCEWCRLCTTIHLFYSAGGEVGDWRNDVLIHQNRRDSTYGMDPCVWSSFSTQLRQLPASLGAVASAKDKGETLPAAFCCSHTNKGWQGPQNVMNLDFGSRVNLYWEF